MSKSLKQAIQNAYSVSNKLVGALGKIETMLVFKGFEEDDIPTVVTDCTEGNINVVWDKHEIAIEEVYNYMTYRGYIEPRDFDFLYGICEH